LEYLEEPIPKIHDLRRLHAIVSQTRVPLEANDEMLAELSDFYIASRYPVDTGSLSLEPPSQETARQLRSFAGTIRDQAVDVLKDHDESAADGML
jgi:HEPN domain-containing protein